MLGKIYSLQELSEKIADLKGQKKRIVHCHGVFDLIHPGHIKHFEAAKKFGDILVVTITEDKHVNKGPDRPIFTESLRAENIAALQYVDFVAINRFPTAITAIEAIKPDFYVKGQDYKNAVDDITGGIIEEKEKVEEFGGKLVFTEEIQFSSSNLINRHLEDSSEEIKNYLTDLRSRVSYEKISSYFDKISDLKVLVIGDIIIDEYQFVNPLGKASKSATITARKLQSELYGGGVLAIANHMAGFAKEVRLIANYGQNEQLNYHDFIKEKLNPKVSWKAIFTADRPTVVKRRFVDKVFKHKLFELIEINDSPFNAADKQKVIDELKSCEENYDLIVVADFGHGLIDSEIVSHIANLKLFTVVNAQTNSANMGYNLLSKYPSCDYFSIDREEARLAMHDKHADIEKSVKHLIQQVKAKYGVVTLGIEGAIIGTLEDEKSIKSPVLSNEIIDTVGAGDAFLSVTALLAKIGVPAEEIVFIGNAVGAMAVKILGNKSYIEKVPLMKYLKTLLT
ncbi:MAG: adenylyltransferase/cytidyltransferase family protein [Bacteroidetes bacterium]|nr:adenylyltransferase/cytidyltransferase family protein [Bacteroidota bacterium]MBT5528240.1 adenylyltransferase/cytidyltransferase family protein [Cytophagia bacterium]MBT6838092.1 adenylyltransferase/cytidyltransferase family protein [Bacteroidota bacterium]